MIGTDVTIQEFIEIIKTEIDKIDCDSVKRLNDLLYKVWENKCCVYVCGNGGSAALASHLCEDLAKGTIYNKDLMDESVKRLRIMSLTDNVPWITAIGNDLAYDQIYVQQLMHFGQEGDLLIAISGSGNSPNIINAVDWANRHGMTTFGFSGYSGGKLKQMQAGGIHIASNDMGVVESIHGTLIHWIVDDLLARINKTGRWAS